MGQQFSAVESNTIRFQMAKCKAWIAFVCCYTPALEGQYLAQAPLSKHLLSELTQNLLSDGCVGFGHFWFLGNCLVKHSCKGLLNPEIIP